MTAEHRYTVKACDGDGTRRTRSFPNHVAAWKGFFEASPYMLAGRVELWENPLNSEPRLLALFDKGGVHEKA